VRQHLRLRSPVESIAKPTAVAAVLGHAAALATTGLLFWFQLLRHWLSGDLWAMWLGEEAAAVDAAIAAHTVTLSAMYVAAMALAALTAWPACRRAFATGRCSPLFLIAVVGAASAGAILALVAGSASLGGTTMQAYACGLSALWIAMVVRILISDQRREPVVVAQWTVYAASLTLLPLTMLSTAPIWSWAANLSPADALVTAATVSFIGHLLVAHGYLLEIAGRRASGQIGGTRRQSAP
jgi:hypothetical protein